MFLALTWRLRHWKESVVELFKGRALDTGNVSVEVDGCAFLLPKPR